MSVTTMATEPPPLGGPLARLRLSSASRAQRLRKSTQRLPTSAIAAARSASTTPSATNTHAHGGSAAPLDCTTQRRRVPLRDQISEKPDRHLQPLYW